MRAPVYAFGDFTLNCDRFELCRAGRVSKLEKKPMELLILLASSSGRLVTRAEIAERLWDPGVFVDTEHGINTAIRKIRQALRDHPEQPRFVQTVTGKGYRFIAPISPVPNPALEETASPAAANPIANSPPRARHRRPAVWLVPIGVASLVALLLVVTLTPHSSRNRFHKPDLHIASLAVLPLDNLSGDPSQDYFANGMTDELITTLAKNSTLHIVSRTSAMQYEGTHRSLREIAQKLGVEDILEGSTACLNNRIHMTIQLIDAHTDTRVWAESFERDANDSVLLSREVAHSVARRLERAGFQTAPVRYARREAHEAYLHGRYLWFTDHIDKAGKYFQNAIELQPDYALAWTGIADYYAAGAVEGRMSPRDSLGRAKAAARKAVSLNDSLAQAHLSLCAVTFFADWNWREALKECARSLELDPKLAESYHFEAKILGALNRHAEAIESERKAMELNPFARPWGLVLALINARQYDAAIQEARARLESTPANIALLRSLQNAYRCKGMESEAVRTAEQAFRVAGDTNAAEAASQAFRHGGYRAVIQSWINYWETESQRRYVSPVFLASLTAQLREREQTLALLEQAYEEHSPLLLNVQFNPAYDFLHSDERYRSIIKKTGIPLDS